MRLLSRSRDEKLVLGYLYEFRNTPMAPPDPRLSGSSIARTLGIENDEAFEILVRLKKKGYVYPFRIGTRDFYRLTCFGTAEVEKYQENWAEVEVSSSRLGFVRGRKSKRQKQERQIEEASEVE